MPAGLRIWTVTIEMWTTGIVFAHALSSICIQHNQARLQDEVFYVLIAVRKMADRVDDHIGLEIQQTIETVKQSGGVLCKLEKS
jgi:hypothetical protein